MTVTNQDGNHGSPNGGVGDESGIHGQIARLARSVHGTQIGDAVGPKRVLHDVTTDAVQLLPAVDHAGVTLIRTQHSRQLIDLESTATTDTAAEQFDALQHQHQHEQGPCLQAIWSETTVRIDDLTTDLRWPELTAAVCASTPIRSSLSIQLYTDGRELGALNLYADTPHAFDPDIQDLAFNLDTHAAIALSGARRGEQFRSALASRDLIGQAKGVIMERFDLDALSAFELLRKLSQDPNIRLAEVAAQLISADHPAPRATDGTFRPPTESLHA